MGLCGLIKALEPYLRAVRGAYVLSMSVRSALTIKTRGRAFTVHPGTYAYVGSALGKGGVYSRVYRHVCGPRRRFWHIDYLMEGGKAAPVGLAVFPESSEKDIAKVLSKAFPYIKGFGSSDSRDSPSHLFKIEGLDSLLCFLKSHGHVCLLYLGESGRHEALPI